MAGFNANSATPAGVTPAAQGDRRPILQIAPERIDTSDGIEVGVEAENVEHRDIRADRDTHPAPLDIP